MNKYLLKLLNTTKEDLLYNFDKETDAVYISFKWGRLSLIKDMLSEFGALSKEQLKELDELKEKVVRKLKDLSKEN